MSNDKCFLCETRKLKTKEFHSEIKSNLTNNKDDAKHRYFMFNSNLTISEPNFYFNSKEIQKLLEKNSCNGNELIRPCACNKKYHKNCILLYLLYTNNLDCEGCSEVYNIKSTEKVAFCTFFFMQNNFLNFLFSLLMIIIISILIGWISISNLDIIDNNFYHMKVFFIFILAIINILIIYVTIENCFSIKNSSPPVSIWVEDKFKVLNEEEISKLNNIISENQNSNQNLFTNNLNNFNYLNSNNNHSNKKSSGRCVLTKRMQKLAEKHKINPLRFESAKNFSDYNEFFFNIFKIEIFESKVNIIRMNKILLETNMKHREAIRELNEDQFQQNILIKHLGFNSANDGLGRFENLYSYNGNTNKDKKSKISRSNSSVSKSSSKNLYKIGKLNNKFSDKKFNSKKLLENIPYDKKELDYDSNDSENEKANNNFHNGINKNNIFFTDKNANSSPKAIKNRRFTQEKESFENRHSKNMDNFNTNINSNSEEKIKFSNNELNNLNLSNLHYVNNNALPYNLQNNNNNISNNNNNEINHGEKLILKDNYFSSKKNSNTNISQMQTSTLNRLKTKQSSKETSQMEASLINKQSRTKDLNNDAAEFKEFLAEEKAFHPNNIHEFKQIQPHLKESKGKHFIIKNLLIFEKIRQAQYENE